MSWTKGEASTVVLTRNAEGEVLHICYDNYECLSSSVAMLLAIRKTILVSYNFRGHYVQIENDCKITVEVYWVF